MANKRKTKKIDWSLKKVTNIQLKKVEQKRQFTY